jgi:enoyl-CoA hydratase
MNEEMIDELLNLFQEIESDTDIRAVVITGDSKAFSAGADIQGIHEAGSLKMEYFIAKSHQFLNKVAHSLKPVIAAIAGPALGGGCELCLACDIRIAAKGAKFGQPEIDLGIIPGAGGTQRLANLVGKGWAHYLILSGKTIKAEDAFRIGLIQELTEPEELLPMAMRLAERLAAKSPLALRAAKQCLNFSDSRLEGLAYEQKAWALLFSGKDQKEGMKAFLEKRVPNFTGE